MPKILSKDGKVITIDGVGFEVPEQIAKITIASSTSTVQESGEILVPYLKEAGYAAILSSDIDTRPKSNKVIFLYKHRSGVLTNAFYFNVRGNGMNNNNSVCNLNGGSNSFALAAGDVYAIVKNLT